jgi:multimeric flavodoxin WrbA
LYIVIEVRDNNNNNNNTTMIDTLAYTLKAEGLSAMRSTLHALNRTTLQTICMQQDHNGVWSDEDNIAEFGCVMPDEAYQNVIERWLTEDL